MRVHTKQRKGLVTPASRVVILFVCVLAILLSPKLAQAQLHAYDQYTVDDGLPSNYVYRLAEDELGYLWAATENGLARFDGYEWKNYGLSDGLTGLDIYSMATLPSGEIVCGGNGMQPMLISKGEVRPFEVMPNTQQDMSYALTNSYPPLISCISDLKRNKGRFRYFEVFGSDSTIQYFSSILDSPKLWVSSHFGGEELAINLLDKVSFPTEMGYVFYCNKEFQQGKGVGIVGSKLFNKESLSNSELNEVFRPDLSLTIGHVDRGSLQTWKSGYLYIFNDDYGVQRVGFDLFDKLFDLNTGMKSRSGDLWLATRSSGVVRISKKSQQVRIVEGTMNVSIEGFAHTSFGTIVADDDSNLYRYSDGNIFPYSRFNAQYETSRFKSLVAEVSGDTAVFVRDRKVYLISSEGIEDLEYPYEKHNRFEDSISDSFRTLEKSIQEIVRLPTHIIGGNNVLIYGDENGAQLISEWRPGYRTLQPSSKGAIGVHVLDQHRLLYIEQGPKISIRWETDTLSISEGYELDADRFLLGTNDKGVYLLDLSGDSVNCKHLFNCAPVKNFKVINGEWWVATYSGVYRFGESGKIELHLDKNSGLLTNETYDIDQVGDSILIATAKGLAVIPQGMQKAVAEPIDGLFVTWKRILVDGVSRKLEGNALRLSPQEDNLEFDFSLLHPSLDSDIAYEVELSPIDEQPRMQRERSVRYASLAPGDYELHVKAILGDGSIYSLESPLHIELLVPLWKRPWFLLLCALLLCTGIYTYVTRRAVAINKRQQKAQMSLRRNSELQLEALRSQMNPHFIFNALGSIQYFIQTEAKDKADEYLGRFAKLMRGYLDGSKRNMTSISDELNMLEQYLELEKMRANGGFSYELCVDPKLSDHQQIPSMLLQPIVENAVIHGLSARKDGKARLIVTLEKNDNVLIATVVDNGQGFINSQKNKRHGHRSRASLIMQERIEALQQAGIARVDLRIEEQSIDVSTTDVERMKFPGVCVKLTIQNIENNV